MDMITTEEKRILIVENETSIATDLCNILHSIGYSECEIVSSGEDALKLVKRNTPDIVFINVVLKGKLDCMMTATQIIESRPIPVIFITGSSHDATVQRMKTVGPFGYICKPFNEQDVRSLVDSAISIFSMEKNRRYREEVNLLTLEILEMLHCVKDYDNLASNILLKIRAFFNLDAVALRLNIDGDYPYFITYGLPEEFTAKHMSLFDRKDDPASKSGSKWSCFCGTVIGKVENCSECITKYGSFWTNDLPSQFKNNACSIVNHNHHGYCVDVGLRSMALIPMKSGDEIVGLLQLAYKEYEQFSESTIQLLERLCCSIGIALESMHIKAEMTKVLANEKKMTAQLQDEHLKTEQANRAKSLFLANISHEIRTPLNGIIGFTSLLKETGLTEEQRNFADNVYLSAEMLMTLINDLIDISKIGSGKIEILNTIDFNIRKTIDSVGELLTIEAKKNGLRFVILINANVPVYVRGDPARLRQILLNLINNAIKFTPNGEVVVSIELIESSETNSTIKFAVRDTGIGISSEDQEKLFQVFSQVDVSNTRKYGGAGLGLAISKQLVELMGGNIGVISEKGVGSTFYFTLVFCKPDQAFLKGTTMKDLQGIYVLVADQHKERRTVFADLLETFKCNVLTASSFDDCINILHEQAKQNKTTIALLLDANEAGFDVFELCKKIKTDTEIANTPLVMLAAQGRQGDAAVARDAGFAAFLIRPISAQDIRDCLLSLLNKKTNLTKPTDLITRHSLNDRRNDKLRILLVDDNYMNQTLTIISLKKADMACDVAVNGIECLAALEKNTYDLILMNCQIPEMNGCEATMKIRNNEKDSGRHIPIIALIENTLTEDSNAYIAAGIDSCLVKPVSHNDLISTIEKWTGNLNRGKTSRTIFEPVDDKTDELLSIPKLMEILDFDRVSVETVLNNYCNALPDQMIEIEHALNVKNTELALVEAHKLKGASAGIFQRQMASYLSEFESCIRKSDFDKARTVLEKCKISGDRIILTYKTVAPIKITGTFDNSEVANKISNEDLNRLTSALNQGDLDLIASIGETFVNSSSLKQFGSYIQSLAENYKDIELSKIVKELLKAKGKSE